MEKEIEIIIPKGYEIDRDNSTFDKIILRKKDTIEKWEDIKEVSGYVIGIFGEVLPAQNLKVSESNRAVFSKEKFAKAAVAMAKISQLMPYYGGEMTDAEWENDKLEKFVINRSENEIYTNINFVSYDFLAFHTREQRDSFLENNLELINDFLMIS